MTAVPEEWGTPEVDKSTIQDVLVALTNFYGIGIFAYVEYPDSEFEPKYIPWKYEPSDNPEPIGTQEVKNHLKTHFMIAQITEADYHSQALINQTDITLGLRGLDSLINPGIKITSIPIDPSLRDVFHKQLASKPIFHSFEGEDSLIKTILRSWMVPKNQETINAWKKTLLSIIVKQALKLEDG